MDFYEPTFLFRQNAIRQPPLASSSVYSGLPYNSTDSLGRHSNRSLGNVSNSSWLLNNNMLSDVDVMNKACLLSRVNIQLNYWKIPDTQMNLTAMVTSSKEADSPLVAISSANADKNLFIYNVDTLNSYLTHHTTITLPNIHGLAWVPNLRGKYLVTGNSKGYAHLVSLPGTDPNEDDANSCAEIVKRFNHRKHLRSVNKDPLIHTHADLRVLQLGFSSPDRLISVYDDTVFAWDINDCELLARPRPVRISIVPGIAGFAPSISDPHSLALCGSFGVSLFDTRLSAHSVPNLKLYVSNSRQMIASTAVRWHPENEYVMACAHGDGVVRLWDVRKQDMFGELTGHRGKRVTCLEWNGPDLFTGASDGNVVHWDFSSDIGDVDLAEGLTASTCTLKEGISSVGFDERSNTVKALSERQCGTPLPALNTHIVGMCLVGGPGAACKVLSVDGLAFLGLHLKIYEAADLVPNREKLYYTQDDLVLMGAQPSGATLVDDEILPLELKGPAATLGAFNEGDDKLGLSTNLSMTFGPEQHADNDLNFDCQTVSDLSISSFEFGNDHESDCVVSLHSIDLTPEDTPQSSLGTLTNDSLYTLSTAETIIGPEAPTTANKKQSHPWWPTEALDGDFERLSLGW